MPLSSALESALVTFKDEKGFVGVGAMGTALIITRRARRDGLPLDPDGLNTSGGGQVAGLSGKNINSILAEHGVTQRVGTESGRTSRGTPTLAKLYAGFLNSAPSIPEVNEPAPAYMPPDAETGETLSSSLSPADLEHIEAWWVARFVD